MINNKNNITFNSIVVYSDGSCLGNPGLGGWAALIKYNETENMLSGSEPKTTNNRMEMQAVIKALQFIKQNFNVYSCNSDLLPTDKIAVTLVTDSQYLKNGLELWIKQWQARRWKTSAGKAVKNKDLWITLLEISKDYSIIWQWVKGHSGHIYNEKVDKAARNAAKLQQKI